jgi:hypothetical protein
MERREFLFKSGMVVSAAFLGRFSNAAEMGNNLADSGLGPKTVFHGLRPDPDQFKEPILKAISYGMNAPNPHNTQAWKFKLLNTNEALFYVDETRLLKETDPPARQIHIGCGSFLALLKIGAGNLGYSAQIDYLPEGSYGLSKPENFLWQK